jgi:hypothetical protein
VVASGAQQGAHGPALEPTHALHGRHLPVLQMSHGLTGAGAGGVGVGAGGVGVGAGGVGVGAGGVGVGAGIHPGHLRQALLSSRRHAGSTQHFAQSPVLGMLMHALQGRQAPLHGSQGPTGAGAATMETSAHPAQICGVCSTSHRQLST